MLIEVLLWVIMKKIFFTFLVIFCLGSYATTQADFPGKQFLQATQQKIALASSCLVNNAWRIAGTSCLLTAAITTTIIAKNTFEDIQIAKSLTPLLTQNATRFLFPVGCSIVGLLCFNVDTFINKQKKIDEIDEIKAKFKIKKAKFKRKTTDALFNILNRTIIEHENEQLDFLHNN